MINRKFRIGIWLLVAMLLTAVLLGGCAQDTDRKGKDDEEDGKELGFASGAGTEESPYLITNEEEFRAIGELSTSGLYFALGNDIPLSGSESPWTPLNFEGNLDGRGFTVSNLYINSNEHRYAGLFASMVQGSIKNLTVRDATVTSTHQEEGYMVAAGGLLGYASAPVNQTITITNCHIVNVSVSSAQDSYTGGLMGFGDNLIIDGCTVTQEASTEQKIVSSGRYAGGLVGWLNNSTVTNCRNDLPITCTEGGAGGIAGTMSSCTLTNCTNSGAITGETIGGMAGWSHKAATITGCTNSGTLEATDEFGEAGGMVGFIRPEKETVTLRDCSNSGAITGYGDLGGIVGMAERQVQFSQVSNTGAITGKQGDFSRVGGVVGECWDTNTIENATNTGALSGTRTGGMVGEGGATIKNATNSGTVYGEEYAGGICGGDNGDFILEDCSNTATVTGGEAGGMIGRSTDNTFTNCQNSGKVTGEIAAGGIIGRAWGDILTDCTNSGAVSGVEYAGGIAGRDDDTEKTNCQNAGIVTGGENNP